jgi:2-polyprenyl-3-methyl-5-hydroxy-6-metoxy-1,4-benzoquinol methylase
MADIDCSRANEEARQAWNHNAAFWDERMDEGNDFVEVLIWPATEKFLALHPGERVLDIACGNGLTSRRMAAAGAEVVALDFSEPMIACARRRTIVNADRIQYVVADATDADALLGLGPHSFEAALCNMALFDMAEIAPLMRALRRLLRSGGRFVFSVLHPCFNNPHMVHVGEMEERGGEFVTVYAVKIHAYMTATVTPGIAMPGQPVPHLYFHRPLSQLLSAGFETGFVLDALEERAFPPGYPSGTYPLSWSGHFSEIPPVLVARMRGPHAG